MNIIVLDPVAEPAADGVVTVKRPRSLQGQKVAVLNNKWRSMDTFAEQFAVIFREQHGAAAVEEVPIPIANAAPEPVLDRVVSEAAIAIVGLAN